MRAFILETTIWTTLITAVACGGDAFQTASPEHDPLAEADAGGSAGEGAGPPDSAATDAGESHEADAGATGSIEIDAGSAGRSGSPGDAGHADGDAGIPDTADMDSSCPEGRADCDGDDSNGCETDIATDEHCGACDHACVDGYSSCAEGACVLKCDEGFDDCDGDMSNGCEADLTTTSSCLSCGAVCEGTEHAEAICTQSGCGHVCQVGWGDCDNDAVNGCETYLAGSIAHCGGCGEACPVRPNATPTCVAAQCGVVCTGSWADCDGAVGNGCEANLDSDTANCGACASACGTAHGVADCNGGDCSIACDSGWGDCDGLADSGCETSLGNDVMNCGACGNACGTVHAEPQCGQGGCEVSCHAGFGNCDSQQATGCEVDMRTDPQNCGACGRSCLGEPCSSGFCVPETLAKANDFAVSGTRLYLSTGSDILTSGTQSGGMSTKLTVGVSETAEPVLSEGRVYFLAGPNPMVLSCAATPISPTPLPATISNQALASPAGLTVEEGVAYWRGSDYIQAIGVAPGSTQRTVAAVHHSVHELKVHAGWIYFVTPAMGTLNRVSVAGTGSAAIVSGQSNPSDLVVDGSTIYWASSGAGTVSRATTSGAGVSVITTVPAASAIAIDGDTLYVGGASGGIWRVSIDGASNTQIAQGPNTPDDIVVDGDWVYWIARSTGDVLRVAK